MDKTCRPAFPLVTPRDWSDRSHGMLLRDYFAAHALKIAWDAMESGRYEGDNHDMAKCAYQIADAMLAARGEAGNG